MMRWTFGADTTPFRKGLDQMRGQTKAFAGSIKGMLIGALGIGAIINGFKNLFVEMDRVQKLGIRFGASAETIQKVGLAADLAGSSVEGIAKAMTVASKNADEAAKKGGMMGEAFAALGIDAGKFVNMSLDQKVLTLAKTFDAGRGSGEQLSLMMQVLGKSGADLVPMLSQGSEELRRQFENTATVSQNTVDKIAAFNDSITSLKQNAQVAGGEVVSFFGFVFGSIKAGVELVVTEVQTGLFAVMDMATLSGGVIKKVFEGDFEGAAEAAKGFKKIASTAMEDAAMNARRFKKEYDGLLDPKGAKGGPQMDVEAVEDAIKAESERKKLIEQIAKLKEDAAMSELSIAEKLLELEKKRLSLGGTIEFSGKESLEEQKEYLEVEKEIKKLKEEQAKNTADASDKEQKIAEKIADVELKKAEAIQAAKDDEAAADRDIAFGKLDEEGQIKMLKKEQADLLKKSDELYVSGDDEGSIKARTEAKLKGSQADDIQTALAESLDKTKSNGPTIAASSLASIGAGGSANLLGNTTIEQRKVSLLEQIAANTGRTETGSSKIPEPI